MTPTNTIVRLIKHEESYEVRVSTFVYFDDNPSRRSINQRASQIEAMAEAKRIAHAERVRVASR